MATLTAQPETEASTVGQLWRERYSDGYRTGRGDAHWGAAPRIDLIVIPGEVAYETGADYVARHVKVLHALACYEYQACEHPQWKGSEAWGFCQALRMRMIGELPGYSDGPWEVTDASQVMTGAATRVRRRAA